MWKLRAESRADVIRLLPGQDYVVGRKNCDVLLSNDQSISRVHAHLTVTEQAVTVKDTSKYGTFVNDEQLATGSTRTLRFGDRLTFGVFQSKFRLELDSVVVCSSCVVAEGKASLSQAVQAVGGRLVSTWTQDCTHLAMPVLKVTIKTICALLSCRPIVTPEFFTELSRAVQRRDALPTLESFRPEMGEPSLTKKPVDLHPHMERKTLFRDKTFVFLSTKQMKRLSPTISCGGGKWERLEEGSVPLSLLESPRTCVISVETGSSQALLTLPTKKWVESVGQVLHRSGLRFIAESEIGLAAIYFNSQTYCNPCISLDSESVRAPLIPGASMSQNATVDETTLPAVSQNITAYVANTEMSQGVGGKVRGHRGVDAGGAAVIGETPERRPRQACALGSPTIPESVNPQLCSSGKADAGIPGGRSAGTAPRSAPTQPDSATLKRSPQKQSSLTSYFQAVNKKRVRETDTDSPLSEAKLSRRDSEEEEDRKMKSSNSAASVSLDPVSRCADQSQRGNPQRPEFSASVGLGSGLGENCGNGGYLSRISGAKKRKEPELGKPSGPEVSADVSHLDVSLDELESIMSVDMDEPLQSAANKKQRVDQGENVGAPSNQCRAEKQQSMANKGRGLENKGLSVTNSSQDSEEKPLGSANKRPDLGREECSSAHRAERPESEDVKEEDVSLVVAPDSFVRTRKVEAIKQDPTTTSSATGPKNDPELPTKVMQIQFKVLTLSAPCRPRPYPLHSCGPNDKNFKRFRKLPVPGLHGLPSIIGGSDLVAHNRSKNAELEEWLRDAAKEEKQQEYEEALGLDLFRYNPKPTKRR
ncbi:nibrin [Electrophorus electricus]|uniref:Nibrin n=1 Tax=Electrophorus electricus TaxID=8005 RepID=A0A4W4EEE4_ELEEL|nr:nibrin [Electrophorus electricus]